MCAYKSSRGDCKNRQQTGSAYCKNHICPKCKGSKPSRETVCKSCKKNSKIVKLFRDQEGYDFINNNIQDYSPGDYFIKVTKGKFIIFYINNESNLIEHKIHDNIRNDEYDQDSFETTLEDIKNTIMSSKTQQQPNHIGNMDYTFEKVKSLYKTGIVSKGGSRRKIKNKKTLLVIKQKRLMELKEKRERSI